VPYARNHILGNELVLKTARVIFVLAIVVMYGYQRIREPRIMSTIRAVKSGIGALIGGGRVAWLVFVMDTDAKFAARK